MLSLDTEYDKARFMVCQWRHADFTVTLDENGISVGPGSPARDNICKMATAHEMWIIQYLECERDVTELLNRLKPGRRETVEWC